MQKGFTLTELMVVIAILAILSTIGVLTYRGAVGQARDARRKTDVLAIASALDQKYDYVNGYYTDVTANDFATHTIPTDPRGYNINYTRTFSTGSDTSKGSYLICAALESNPSNSCSASALDCYCQSSSTAGSLVPTPSGSSGGITPTPTPTPGPTLPPSQIINVKVLAIKYFPLDSTGTSIDTTVTGLDPNSHHTLQYLRDWTTFQDNNFVTIVSSGTAFHGYKDPSAIPALSLSIIDTKEFDKAAPLDSNHYFDYAHQILNGDVNICSYVDNQGVSLVLVAGYQTSSVNIWESDASMGLLSKQYWNYSDHGNVSNGNGGGVALPTCNHSYTVVTENYNSVTGGDNTNVDGNFIHAYGHQIESILEYIGPQPFDGANSFRQPFGSTSTVNHCGDIHQPPNNSQGYGGNYPLCPSYSCAYNYISNTYAQSDCEDWHPDGGGQVKSINCSEWSCDDITNWKYYVWWMQNIPGLNNGLTYQGKQLRNWWEFLGDLDSALAKGKSLTY